MAQPGPHPSAVKSPDALAPQREEVAGANERVLTLKGDWIAGHADAVERLASHAPDWAPRVTFDLGAVRRLDTFGAWTIETLLRGARAAGAEVELVGVQDRNAAILAQMQRIGTPIAPPAASKATLMGTFEAIGRGVFGAVEATLAVLSLLGRLVAALVASAVPPWRLRGKSVVHHMDQVGVRAAPIVALMTFLIGCIIAQQGFFYFQKFGASDYVVDLVTILVLREIGVLLVVIMIAGRSGSSYTAEIGSMKMREEIDALRTMGLDPVDMLILPRVLALVIAAPMLTLLGMFAALFGAGLVAWTYADMSPATFLVRLQEAATWNDLEVGLIKAPVMALAIGVIAAVEGAKVRGSAESLGLSTTASVVKSIFLVIVLDGCFAILFATVGM